MAEKIVKDSQGLVNDLANDCISRKAAIDAVSNMLRRKFGIGGDLAEITLAELPSAQPTQNERVNSNGSLDTVSRQAAIDAIDSVLVEDESCKVWFKLAVKNLPSAQPYTDEEIQKMQDIEQAQLDKAYEMGKADAMRWIPCSERLPEPDERVLVYTVANEYHVWDAMPHRGEGYEWEDEEGLYHSLYEVAMWLPLPEPYAERRQNE